MSDRQNGKKSANLSRKQQGANFFGNSQKDKGLIWQITKV